MAVVITGNNTPTAGGVTYGDGTTYANTAAGTSGQLLQSNGASAPTWATVTATPGVNVQTFTGSGTWSKPAGYASTSRVLIQCWGAGGSGSKNSFACCGIIKQGGGGGGGGYNYRWTTLSALGATETVTIGAGGTAVSAANTSGNSGGTTSFGSLTYAYGGAGGSSGGAGGGGGGQLSAGSGAQSGSPTPASINVGNSIFPEGAGGANGTSSSNAPGVSALYKGGGGGATFYSLGNYGQGANGGAAVWGGGGGGGGGYDVTYGPGTGGASSYGGAGSNGTTTTAASAGTQPGGGGGGTKTGTSGAGGAGQVIVTVFAGV